MPRGYRVIKLEDFSGGLNLRAAPSELADNESPDCMNVTCDEFGGIVKRLGYTPWVEEIEETGFGVKYMFYSQGLFVLLFQINDTIYWSDGVSITSIHTFSDDSRVHMADFLSEVVIVHPVDRCFSWDGSTLTGPIANSPKASVVAIWQNAIWTAGDPDNDNRLTRSDLGAFTWPTTPVYNDIRDRDDSPITALMPSQGMDDQGRAGLLIFKSSATYRAYDSATGAYATLSVDAGAIGALAVCTLYGNTYFINRKGIYVTDGLAKPSVLTEKIEPLFHTDQLDFQTGSQWCAAAYQDRVVFALGRSFDVQTTGHNDIVLESNPAVGWWVVHKIAVGAFAQWDAENTKLLFGHTTKHRIFELFVGWDDDGEAIPARWQSRWYEPGAGYVFRMRRLLVSGRGAYSLYVKANYSLGTGILCPVAIGGEEGLWGTGIWGIAIWGPLSYENYQSFHSLGIARAVSFALTEESTTSELGPKLLQDGIAPQVGSFGLYGLHLDVVPLTPS